MIVWIRIAGTPPRNFIDREDARALIAPGESVLARLESTGSLSSDSRGETPNMTITLRNDDGALSRLFALPPVGEAIELRNADGVLFTGLVNSVAIADKCTIEAQA